MWLQLVTTLPNENAAVRQRVWRALKSSGAAVLRDGVYLMPETPACRQALEAIAADVRSGNGTVWILRLEEPEEGGFKALFDRGSDYAPVMVEITTLTSRLSSATEDAAADVLKQARKLRKAFAAVAAIDFFAGPAREQTEAALVTLEQTAARILSPDEPHSTAEHIQQIETADYQGRLWATRRRPWVDRLASAWLIKRFIDPTARFLWLQQPADCPHNAVGFDFDGATFTHVGNRVTFEVLVASFGLQQPALPKLGALVHYLDVGGVQPAEAVGVEMILAGLRAQIQDDDLLLKESITVFDSVYAALTGEKNQ
jgi:hypothetical protein